MRFISYFIMAIYLDYVGLEVTLILVCLLQLIRPKTEKVLENDCEIYFFIVTQHVCGGILSLEITKYTTFCNLIWYHLILIERLKVQKKVGLIDAFMKTNMSKMYQIWEVLKLFSCNKKKLLADYNGHFPL